MMNREGEMLVHKDGETGDLGASGGGSYGEIARGRRPAVLELRRNCLGCLEAGDYYGGGTKEKGAMILSAFPNAGQFLVRHWELFLVAIPLMVSACFMWYAVIRAKRKQGKSILKSGLAPIALVVSVIGAGWSLGLVGALSQWLRFRIDPDDVEAIRVQRLAVDGSEPNSDSFVLTDTPKIHEGLARLSRAGAWFANHETLKDGYHIEFKLRGESGWSGKYLSIYRHTTRNRNVFVVIPHVGPGHWGAVDKAGDYRCPEFWEWFDDAVVPLLENSP